MTLLQMLVLALVTLSATGVVLTREPLRQTLAASFYGLTLGILFFVLQAPDVALSQIAIGTVGMPIMILLALAKVRGRVE